MEDQMIRRSTFNGFNLNSSWRVFINLSIIVFAAIMLCVNITFKKLVKVDTGSDIWQNNSLPISKLGDIFERYNKVGVTIFEAANENNETKLGDYISQISDDTQAIDEDLDFCAKSAKTMVEVRLYKNAVLTIGKYWDYLNTVENLLLQRKNKEAKKLLSGDMALASGNYMNILDSWIKLNLRQGK